MVALLAAGSKEVICPKARSNSHDSTEPKIRPRNTTIRPMKPRKPTAMAITAIIVSRATHWSWGQ